LIEEISMEDCERKLILDQLDASRQRLLTLVDGLTLEQWTFRPAEGRWSIGDCIEHVVQVENRLIGRVEKKLQEPPNPDQKPSAAVSDEALARMVPDRTNRFEAPEAARPLGRWTDPNDLLTQFHVTRARTCQFVEQTDADLRSHFMPHPVFGELDCFQWLLALSLHGERHARQIDEIKEADAFPKGELTFS
jgi:uncharacterized damage-inducible protein DinB